MGLKNLVMRVLGETKIGEKWSEKDVDDMLRWRSEDMPWTEVAKKLRRTRTAVKRKYYLVMKNES